MRITLFTIGIALGLSLSLSAQNDITDHHRNNISDNEPQLNNVVNLLDCIDHALYANYSIKIARNELKILQNNITLAPFLPTLSAGATQRQNRSWNKDYDNSGAIIEGDSKGDNYGLNANLSWTIFDGLKMFATKEMQQVLLSQGELTFKSNIQNLVADVIHQYYLIVRMQYQEKLLQEYVSISKIRHEQALIRYMIGRDSGLEYKQAKIYLNNDSTSLLVQQENLMNAYVELYRMMNVPLNSSYAIKDTILKGRVESMESLKEKMMEKNLWLQRVKAGEELSELDLKIVRSERYPKLAFSAGYNMTQATGRYFPQKFDETQGANWGFTLSVPIFNGGETNRKIRNAKISRENAALSVAQAEQTLHAQLTKLYNTYENNLRLIEFEEESTEAAYFNLEAAMEKYRLGALSGIEFREIQTSYLNASVSKFNAQYNAKILELDLYVLAGEL